ncbi:MAG: multicomponent Na+:H+ antiporter subunit B [Candidatus Deianiraeaceae bacterium]|jgi:multicomponent Na+:H+ antiporter subunit B
MFNSIERLALRFVSVIVLIGSTIFAFYIHIFGKVTPGGGFQAGALLASGIIIYQSFNDVIIINKNKLNISTVCGVMMFLLTGVASLFFGGTIFEYQAFHHHYGHIIGSFLVETGVFLVVTTSMVRIANALWNY